MSSNYTEAKNSDKQNRQEQKKIEKTIYIGVFFDGTGNNKFQVMMGKLFRSTKAIEKNITDAKGRKYSIAEVRSKGRSYWQMTGAFSQTELDEIFWGYDNTAQGEDPYFIENSIHAADIVGQQYPIEDSDAQFAQENLGIYKAGRFEFTRSSNSEGVSNGTWNALKLTKGGDIQGSTYTNVAVLEALYQTDNQQYFPIYVEGAGTDMNMSVFGGTLDYWGAGTGTWFTGVWSKVKKGANAVARLCDRYVSNHNVSKLTVHISTYGFSRGATEARMFSYIVNTKKNEIKEVLKKHIGRSSFLEDSKIDKHLEFVGIFDTVATVGVSGHEKDVDELYLYGVDNAEHALHLCAMDEFRSNFALTDMKSAFGIGLELFMPGCHTDVGGGVTLGVDDWKQIDKNQLTGSISTGLTEGCLISKWGRNNRQENGDVNVNTFKDMGWLPSTAKSVSWTEKFNSDKDTEAAGALYRETNGKIQIRKYVKPGYTNVALHLMYDKALEYVEFKPIPQSYAICGDLLKDLYGSWSKCLGKTGQEFVPVKNKDYRDLRAKYLHYSGDDSTGYDVVNGVSHKPLSQGWKLITRKIYVGSMNEEKKMYYLNDLKGNSAPSEPVVYYITNG